MDIDKASMLAAYNNRDNPKEYAKLIGYFYEMADFFTNQSKVSPYHKDDYIQEAVTRACNKMHLFNPHHINSEGNVSEVFSYFYRLISFHVKYCIRDTTLKRQRRPATCSYDVISAMVGDPTEENGYDFGDFNNIAQGTFDIADPNFEDKDRFLNVDGNVYPYAEVMNAIRELESVKKQLSKDVNLVCEFKHKLTHIFFEKQRAIFIEKNALKKQTVKTHPAKNATPAAHTPVSGTPKSAPVLTISSKADRINPSKESKRYVNAARNNPDGEAIMRAAIAEWEAKLATAVVEANEAWKNFNEIDAALKVAKEQHEVLLALKNRSKR
jgi:hypothetical protein